jgi:hypothetical protein
MDGITIIIILAVLALIVFATLIAHGTMKKTDWGLNFGRVTCPRCGTAMPAIRSPSSFRETFWGGGTCSKCGCEMDKWGREISR